MVMFWVSLLAISILLYVLLDGVDLGVGLLFGLTTSEARRGTMLRAVRPLFAATQRLVCFGLHFAQPLFLLQAALGAGILAPGLCSRHHLRKPGGALLGRAAPRFGDGNDRGRITPAVFLGGSSGMGPTPGGLLPRLAS